MTIRQYLDGLAQAVERGFADKVDQGRQMSMSHVGRLAGLISRYASDNGELPMLPYDAETKGEGEPE